MVFEQDFAGSPRGDRASIQTLSDGRELAETSPHSPWTATKRFENTRFCELAAKRGVSLNAAAVQPMTFPALLWSANRVLEMVDSSRASGGARPEAAKRVVLKDRLNECLLNALRAFSSTILGL